jgi:predicted nicotinamide N-methyase
MSSLDKMESDVQEDVEYEVEDFTVGPYHFGVTTIAFMPIDVLMKMGDKKVEISGQKLWCGSLGVIEYLLDNKEFVKEKTVLELGAGTGVLGMLCHRLQAQRVILTDNDPRSLRHMVEDCDRNGVIAEVCSLDWFDSATHDNLHLERGGPGSLRIVAGDVLYKQPLLEPFMSTVHSLLSKYTLSQMLLCHIPRAGIDHAAITSLALAKGLCVEEVDPNLWRKGSCVEYSPEEDYSRAKLYLIRL